MKILFLLLAAITFSCTKSIIDRVNSSSVQNATIQPSVTINGACFNQNILNVTATVSGSLTTDSISVAYWYYSDSVHANGDTTHHAYFLCAQQIWGDSTHHVHFNIGNYNQEGQVRMTGFRGAIRTQSTWNTHGESCN